MSTLQGSLKVMPVGEVLDYLERRRLSGTLRCERGPVEKSVVVSEGAAILATSNDPREYLGQFLLNLGHLGEDDLRQAFATQQTTNVPLGRIAVMVGHLDESTLQEVLALKIRETLFSILEWGHGTFHFSLDEVPDLNTGVPVSVALASLGEEAEFRRTTWEAIRKVFPHGSLALEVKGGGSGGKSHPLDARILELAAEGKTINGIALALHATPFALYQRLYALYREGALAPMSAGDEVALEVDLDDLEVEIDVGDEDPAAVGDLVSAAREHLGGADYAAAEAVALRAVALDRAHPSAQAVLKEARTGLNAQLRARYLARPLVPRVAKKPQRTAALTETERYLLARCDGETPLRQIIQAAALRQLEALKAIEKLEREGLVKLA